MPFWLKPLFLGRKAITRHHRGSAGGTAGCSGLRVERGITFPQPSAASGGRAQSPAGIRRFIQKQLAELLAAAVNVAKDNFAKAQMLRAQKTAKLTALEAQLENARLLAQVNDLTRELRASPLGPQTELGQKFEAFERRVASLERQASVLGGEARGSALID